MTTKERQAHGQTAPGKTLVVTLPQASNGKSRDKAGQRVGRPKVGKELQETFPEDNGKSRYLRGTLAGIREAGQRVGVSG